MTSSASIAHLAAALVAAQGEFEVVVKDAENPYFKSNYATLKAVRDMLAKHIPNHGMCYVQGTETVEGVEKMATTIIHESGEWLTTYTPFFTSPTAEKTNDGNSILRTYVKPHDGGSAITYSKRYGLQAAFGVVVAEDEDDDDGNRANGNRTKQANSTTNQPKPQADALGF